MSLCSGTELVYHLFVLSPIQQCQGTEGKPYHSSRHQLIYESSMWSDELRITSVSSCCLLLKSDDEFLSVHLFSVGLFSSVPSVL